MTSLWRFQALLPCFKDHFTICCLDLANKKENRWAKLQVFLRDNFKTSLLRASPNGLKKRKFVGLVHWIGNIPPMLRGNLQHTSKHYKLPISRL
ncbi:MAG: hypothetical protein ACK559_38225, partial [bacterium]